MSPAEGWLLDSIISWVKRNWCGRPPSICILERVWVKMAINFSLDIYKICQDTFAVPVTFHPVFSQPDGASYEARGIYNTRQLEVLAEDGSVFNDQQTILDIRKQEFAVVPQQKDRVTVPFNSSGEPLGDFEIVETSDNGGGEITLVIRRFLG